MAQLDVRVKKSPKRTLYLAAAIAVCLLLITVLVIAIAVISAKEEPCLSPECVTVAAGILSSMNLSADPCHDFANFACGKWQSTVEIPEGSPSWSVMSVIRQKNERLLQKLLTAPGSEYMGVHSDAVYNAKAYYVACINTSAIEARGAQPLLKYIAELGSCPLLTNVVGAWDVQTWSLEKAVAKVQKFMIHPLFRIYVSPDLKTNFNIMMFDQSGLSIYNEPDFYIGPKADFYREAVLEYAREVYTLLGATGDIPDSVRELWQFETELAKIFDGQATRQNISATYNKMTVGDFKLIVRDWFDLDEYFTEMFGYPLSDSEEVIIRCLDYLYRLRDLMASTEKRVLANYIITQVVKDKVDYLSSEYKKMKKKLQSVISGDSSASNPPKECLKRLNTIMPDITGALYIEFAFADVDVKENIEEELQNLVHVFKKRIEKLDWMDDETKEKAYEKVKSLGGQIAYPEITKHPDQLDKKYMKFTFTDKYFENARSSIEVKTLNDLDKRGKLVDNKEWSFGANQVNAYYHPMFNTMVFMAGILNPPFYDANFPAAINYGAIGSVIGHEMTHGFDIKGRQFDAHGKLVNWWSPSSEAAFLEKTKCLIDQYNKFEVGDLHVNGRRTVGENMADVGGMQSAYDAYMYWRQTHHDKHASLPGLPLNPHQLFFLGFAKTWCGYMTPKYAEISIATDSHAEPKYRVMGSLQNSQIFADAFNCPVGSRMNPATKCVIW